MQRSSGMEPQVLPEALQAPRSRQATGARSTPAETPFDSHEMSHALNEACANSALLMKIIPIKKQYLKSSLLEPMQDQEPTCNFRASFSIYSQR